jgi:hypothetical protein
LAHGDAPTPGILAPTSWSSKTGAEAARIINPPTKNSQQCGTLKVSITTDSRPDWAEDFCVADNTLTLKYQSTDCTEQAIPSEATEGTPGAERGIACGGGDQDEV